METCKKCGKTGKNRMKDGLCKSCRMKVWTCKKCGNSYKSIYERDVCIECEQKNTNIVCNVCGRSFKTKKSLSNHSRYHDSEYTNMMSDKQKGRVFSEETRKKMSESARRRKDSDETKAKKSQIMRDSLRKLLICQMIQLLFCKKTLIFAMQHIEMNSNLDIVHQCSYANFNSF